MKFLKYTVLFMSVLAFLSVSAGAQEIGGVKGKVRNSRGIGLAEVAVTARQNERDIKTTTTDNNGEFVIDGLRSGKYTFIFNKNGFTSGTINNVEVGKNKIRDLGTKLFLDIDDGTLVVIKGSVFDSEGRSIYGAKIEIARVLGDGTVKKINSSYSSQDGEFTFRFSKGTATFRITAFAKGKSASKDVTVDEAAIYRTAITLNLEKEKDKNQNSENYAFKGDQ